MRNRNNEVLLAVNIDMLRVVDQKPECHLEWPYMASFAYLEGDCSLFRLVRSKIS